MLPLPPYNRATPPMPPCYPAIPLSCHPSVLPPSPILPDRKIHPGNWDTKDNHMAPGTSSAKGGRRAYTDGHILSHLVLATCNPTALLMKPRQSGTSVGSCPPHRSRFLPNHVSGGRCIPGQLQGQGQNGNPHFTGCKLCLQHQSRSVPTWGGVPSTPPARKLQVMGGGPRGFGTGRSNHF